MRVVFINGKKVMVASILVVLMIVLIFIESYFHENLKETAWIQNNITSLQEYNALDGEIVYKLPAEWEATESDFGYDGVLYHNEFYDNSTKVSGYIQVREKKNELSYVIQSKVSDKKEKVKYNYQPVKVNSNDAYFLTYSVQSNNDSELKAYEYLIEGKDFYVNLSFFVRKEEFKDNMARIFNGISETIIINDDESLN